MPIFAGGARWGAIAAVLLAAAPVRSEPVQDVGTGGLATLTMCQSWVVYASCRTYHHIAVPARIAIGDTVVLEFGSNPKEYQFPVVRIVHSGNRCTIYSDASGEQEQLNRLVVEPCPDRSAVR